MSSIDVSNGLSKFETFALFCSKLPDPSSVRCLIFVRLRSSYHEGLPFFVFPHAVCKCVMIPSRSDYTYFHDERLEDFIFNGYRSALRWDSYTHVIIIPRSCKTLDLMTLHGFNLSSEYYIEGRDHFI